MPGSIRLFVDAALETGATVAATAGQAHYLGAVMRRADGDPVLLFNGADGEWQATIADLRRDRARFAVTARTRAQAPEPARVLLFAPLKRDATELVIEKATELGVARIQPVLTARTNTARLNLDRLAAIATEAAEQCERLTVPPISPIAGLHDALAAWAPDRPLVMLAERSGAAPVPPLADRPAGLLVGPEGGFTPAELDATRRLAFVVPASLGPRILRAETAVIAGLALMQARAVG